MPYKSVLKYPGSKWRIANWIIEHMPPHHSYVEPFFGSGAVFFTKEPSKIETINDLDNDVVNLFRLIRNDPEPLIKAINLTPYSRAEYESAYISNESDNDIEKARKFLIRCWQGYGYRTNDPQVGWKNDVQGREAAYCVRNWNRLPEWIAQIVDRLKEVQIENRPADEIIKRFNYENVFIYADPPYLLSTRTSKQYKHELASSQQHIELLETLINHKGSVILSGYESDLYNETLKGWDKYSVNAHAEKGLKRTECIWVKSVVPIQMTLKIY